ncbi:MAG: PolC-type DNA polymerase III [Syntrophomonadaceae bacterium]|nr:PolC-type DNA polymerase III [Syntrophomonadaceae bacterium]
MDFYAFIQNIIKTDEAVLWRGSSIQKVEVYPRKALWRFYLTVPELIEKAKLKALASDLKKVFGFLKDVELVTAPADYGKCVGKIMEENFYRLLAVRLSGTDYFSEISWRFDKNVIEIITSTQDAYEAILENEFCNCLSDWFWEEYQYRILVRVQCEEKIQEKKPAQYLTDFGKITLPLIEEDKKQTLPKRGKKNTKLKPISMNSQHSVPLNEVEEGMKMILVQGEIWDKNVHMLKGDTYVITYFITDGKNSLAIKSFCDRLELDNLNIGDYAAFRGNPRYDQGAKEIVLVMNGYVKGEKQERQDESAEKRIELHAHTKMSAMDGLTEIEDLIRLAARWRHKAIAITDHGCIQAFPDAYKYSRKYNIKIIYGVEGYLVDDDKKEKPHHIIILARNLTGLRNLYSLISVSYLDNFYRFPKLKRAEIIKYREGLLLGSACESGELFRALLERKSEEEIFRLASFYDYLEIQPIVNNEFLLRNGTVNSQEQLQDIVKEIIELGRRLGKPVVATGDVHFLEPEHEIFRKIIQSGQGYDDAEGQAPLYFKSTDEMLEEFSFLPPEVRNEAVIEAPKKINELIDDIQPVPDGYYPPKMDGAEEELVQLTMLEAHRLYGETLPELVEERINRELKAITEHGFGVLYMVAHKLVKKSNEDGYMVGSRGSVGSSLVAYLTGVTEVNPLKPHYRCGKCFYTEFSESNISLCGVDLPDNVCPNCGQPLSKDGFDIPFETFLGFDGDKVPDIDLNFSGDYQSKAHQYVEEIFGKENVFRAGTVSTIADKKAYGFVKKYAEEQNLNLTNSEINRLIKGISGVRKTTGQHPGGLIILPRGHNVNEFTPLQHPADKKDSGVITTHFEYHALGDQLVKLDILGHDDPTVIRSLEELTGIKVSCISLSDKDTMKIFSSVEPLGIKSEDIDSRVGTLGIPEFGTRFVRQMLETTLPTTFAELVRISGLSHGTDVWVNNAQPLISQKIAALNQVICTRDDIMTYLIQEGIEKKKAFKIMEQVRKGQGLKPEDITSLKTARIASWYIDSCQKIKYMFPKAHAVAYVTMAFRIAYFKVNYPLEFYASFFSIRAEDFESKTILQGYDAIKTRIGNIESNRFNLSPKDKKTLPVLEIALEMWARGFKFYPVDIYESQANNFIIKGDGLLLPFSALPNVGLNAAQGIVEGRGEKEFISIEDFQVKTHLNKASMEILRESNCFAGLPESNQMDLFA